MQWAVERAELLDSTMAGTSDVIGGLLFVAAGSYQWTRLKDICLTGCQTPFAFLMRHGGFRGDAGFPNARDLPWRVLCRLLLDPDGPVARGRRNERLWIVLFALLIFLEKVTPFGRQIAPPCWLNTRSGGCLAVFNGNVIDVQQLPNEHPNWCDAR